MRPRHLVAGIGACLSAMAAALPAHAQTGGVTDADLATQRFMGNGVAAIVEGKVITYDAVRRRLTTMLPQIQQSSANEKEFYSKLDEITNDIIQSLVDRELIIKEFFKPLPGKMGAARQVPEAVIDKAIADEQAENFQNDRSKFLAWLNSNHMTMKEHRKEVADDIVFQWMKGQQRRSESIVSPVRIETYYRENLNQFHQDDRAKIRTLQMERNPGESDEALLSRLREVAAKFKEGSKFIDLIASYSVDGASRAKTADWIEKDKLLDKFGKPVFALKKGEITDPIVDGNYGYLIYVEDREFEGIRPLDSVRSEIEVRLVQLMAQESTERWLERLRRDGFVKRF